MYSFNSRYIVVFLSVFLVLALFFVPVDVKDDNYLLNDEIVSLNVQMFDSDTGELVLLNLEYGDSSGNVDIRVGVFENHVFFDDVDLVAVDGGVKPNIIADNDMKQKIEQDTERVVNDFVWVETNGFVPEGTGGKIILSSIGQKTFKCDGTVDNPDCFEIGFCSVSEKPCYEFEGGNTIVYVNHFSGASNTMTWTTDADWDSGNYENTSSELGSLGLCWSGGFYCGLGYRKAINVSSTSALTDYQVNLYMTWDSDMQDNFEDIRFTYYNETSDIETQIPYWIESNYTQDNATVWIKTNLTSGDNTVYMYYGDTIATSESNATLVFDPLGDWKSDWKYYTSSSCTGPANWEKISFDDSGWVNLADASLDSWPNGGPMDWYMRKKIFITSVSTSSITIQSDDGQWSYAGDGTYIGHCGGACHGSGTCTNAWTITSTLKKGDNVVAIQCSEQTSSPQWGEVCLVNAFSISNSYLRKETATLPTTSFGAEQTPPTTGQYTSNITDTVNTISRIKAIWNATNGWKYKKEINISNVEGILTDYLVKIVIDKELDMNADYSDLRFTDYFGVPLNYWIEKDTVSDADVWVKVNLSASTNTTINLYYGNNLAVTESNGTALFLFFDDFSDSTFTSYQNRITGGCIQNCITSDNMANLDLQSLTYYRSPYGSFIDTGGTGFCGDAGLMKELTLPNTVSNISITFAIKGWGAYWASSRGFIIERDSYGYGPKACNQGQTYYWLACASRSGNGCGSPINPETGLIYTPPTITGTWQEFTRDITSFSGDTFRLRMLTHDYSCSWCNMGDHPQDLWVDDIRVREYILNEPTISYISSQIPVYVSIEVTADGTNWLAISNNTNYTAGGGIGSGNNLQFRVILETPDSILSPKLHETTLEYETCFNSCGILSNENGQYLLNNDVSSSGTCFIIGADNITLDCQGHTINYSQSGIGYGVELTSGFDNITIKNCNIVQGSEIEDSSAVYLSSSWDSLLLNNTITTFGDSAYGLYLSNSKNNTVYNTELIVSDVIDIYVRGTNDYKNYIINSTFDAGEIYFDSDNSGSIEILWPLGVYVNDSTGTPISDVNISIWQIDGTFMFSKLTDSFGGIGINVLLGSMQNNTEEYVINYVMDTTKDGYVPDSRMFTLSTFQLINIPLLVNEPPQITIDSPLNSLYNHQAIWFNVSVTDDWNSIDWCGYSLNGSDNVTLSNDSMTNFYFLNDTVSVGYYDLVFYCNDSYGVLNSTDMIYFEVLYDCMTDSDCSEAGDICIYNGCVSEGCTEFCTTNVDLSCHSECDGVNGCNFYDTDTSNFCDDKPYGQWVEYDATQVINCCEGAPKTSYEPDVTYAGLNPLTVPMGDVADIVVSVRNRNDFSDTFTISLESL
ncbi:MAG: DUF2341 domain-containing protein, partial [Nanohaloarchaea archaeon]|nr:DUF2341 domain-containing protein [Candidatus Nanohaloarchaea archaeon]